MLPIPERFLPYPCFVGMHTTYSQTLFPITTEMHHISPSEEVQVPGKSLKFWLLILCSCSQLMMSVAHLIITEIFNAIESGKI